MWGLAYNTSFLNHSTSGLTLLHEARMKALEQCNAWLRWPAPYGGSAVSGLWKAGCYGFFCNISSWKWAPTKDTQWRVYFLIYIKGLQFHLGFIESSSQTFIENGSHTHIHNKSHILYKNYTVGIIIASLKILPGSNRLFLKIIAKSTISQP
jgi:hypothetical protein